MVKHAAHDYIQELILQTRLNGPTCKTFNDLTLAASLVSYRASLSSFSCFPMAQLTILHTAQFLWVSASLLFGSVHMGEHVSTFQGSGQASLPISSPRRSCLSHFIPSLGSVGLCVPSSFHTCWGIYHTILQLLS